MKYVDRTLMACSHHMALCVDEKSYHRELKRLKLPASDWEPFVSSSGDATTHFLESGRLRLGIVCIAAPEDKSGIEVAALLVHEAVHIWRAHCSDIGEKEPSEELEAYAIQSISQALMQAYADLTVKNK